ncbi:Head-to-tail connector protein, podovirus-type [uncultured Caudovirales phage]|uniref:Head-to-tail connector protein, podovirus-type n=1 Tax=uncultured Caudovirales phage TaxID=2100421 RepID=A0A6J5SCS0_9CAUD|nr:Head-to-tail connector protein, podovirus-type [uncultured Caudovirales phage]CAB4197452.1 Head-to-tail connector protein, podovirus-type [uncultured Caudovirales phage]CAB4211380.1 Head-to-tail connector protein, podovirus-type [uncultured Caudovirales phage]CAB5227244.1 Head-to-tail connector protein, podovirus-type [uncultured Caudovirales phage]
MATEFTEYHKKLVKRHAALTSERSSWISHWQEISDYLLPRSGRFFASDRNRGGKRHNSIIDSTGTRALRVLAAGLLAGMTSPARPWFRLSIKDTELADYDPVKRWLADVTMVMQQVFSRSNTYRALHSMYGEVGAFGTGAAILLPDYNNVIHNYTLTTGEYCIATDYQGRVNTLYRQFEKTVGEIVREFGKENCSTTVQNMFNDGNLDNWIPLIHVIEPRADREYGKTDAKNMAFKSCTFEGAGTPDKYLRESGFKRFRALVPRWDVAGGDVYGNSPGMEALGDIKSLQQEQLRKGQGIDYKTQPPLQVPTSLKNQPVSRLPGGLTYVDSPSASGAIHSLWNVDIDLGDLREDIMDVRQRINQAFFSDVFIMLATSQQTQMTATEVAERHEEKMLMLGPVLERLHNELLEPLIEMTFDTMIEAGIVPPAPQELHGVELDVEFVSMLAQAQRAIGVNSVDRFTSSLGAIAAIKPDVLDKLDVDRWADHYADILGVPPDLIVPSDQVAMVRQSRAEVAQQKAMLEAGNVQADTANKLAGAKTSEPNALDMLNQFSGYGSPTGVQV